MYVSPNQMPADSRIWIYQSSRMLSADEIESINSKAKSFIENWTSHQIDLRSSFEIVYNIFLVIQLDEKHASAGGCSIDKSLHFIKQLESDFSISLLDRNIFAYKENDKINLLKRNEFENKVESGIINDDTIVFNNLVQTKEQFENEWEIPLSRSWIKTIL
jgi:hypothetical protein